MYRMTPQVEDTLKSLPLRPGVYRMIGPEEVVLYVSKAKNLKSRVSSYSSRTITARASR